MPTPKPTIQDQCTKLWAKLEPFLSQLETEAKEEYQALRMKILQRLDGG